MIQELSLLSRIDPDGADDKVGGVATPLEYTLTNGERQTVQATVADNYTKVTLWTTGQYGISSFDIAVIETLYAQMDTITPEDIMRAAKKYFTPERRTVVVLKGGQS